MQLHKFTQIITTQINKIQEKNGDADEKISDISVL